jgi:hypothetical protein
MGLNSNYDVDFLENDGQKEKGFFPFVHHSVPPEGSAKQVKKSRRMPALFDFSFAF